MSTALTAARLSAFGSDAGLIAHSLDLLAERVLVVDLGWPQVQDASFLDDRVLQSRPAGAWISEAELHAAAERAPDPAGRLGFIFHIGHVGSTLISRLLGAGGAGALREPAVLRQLAEADEASDEAWDPVGPERRRALFTSLARSWARAPEGVDRVIVKATSLTSGLSPDLLRAAPDAPSLLLSMGLEPYLAALLAPEAPSADLVRGARVRFARLKRAVGDPGWRLYALSPGELAAASWVSEMASLDAIARAQGTRALALDFEAFLAEPATHLNAAAAHMGLVWPDGEAERILASGLMTRYAKAPEHAYDAGSRTQILAQSRARNAEEIAKGRTFAEAALARIEALSGLADRL